MLELLQGELGDRADTRARLREHYYERVYLNCAWYDAAIMQALNHEYFIERNLPLAAPPFSEYRWGWQYLTPAVPVMSPRASHLPRIDKSERMRAGGN